MSEDENSFWYCLKHHRVEGYDGCKNADRIGPFATEAEAGRALQTVAERNKRYDAEDAEWNDGN